ncbi:resuscitation-promoting factor [Actinotalea fermentans]|uniref:resuscitation-promoting factor n=1 Tax=Actinotalea fermentans TaxID=43671 RepID=UPI00051F361B|nr:resuscitation-promoting factor [Actinotalea fermentans]KGM15305.1 hypothetical protein N867_09920 [Actinotalea fermentans ATCC 43279 = JCM 9966 = DSM 3133]
MTFSLPRALRRSTSQTPADPVADVELQNAPGPAAAAPTAPGRGRSVVRLGALAAAAVVLVTGSVAVARAHKTVTLDIDGEVVQVGTFAGSVEGLLDDRGVDVGSRDVVAPDLGAELDSGDEIVVRHAHALRVLADGEETTVWTTALTADEALEALAARGSDVRLVPSRSTGGTRPDLSLRLRPDGPVDVVVDGRTERVADGSVGVEAMFADLGISLAARDRVTISPAATPGAAMTVLVQRVVVREVPSTSEVPFDTVTQASAELYRGESRTVTTGVPGELRRVHRVVMVDGVEESRQLLEERLTREPVTAVVHEGTRARPARTSTGGGAVVLDGGVWDALARCESGGNPGAISASGKYYGLFQFSLSTWQAMGGSGLPSDAPASEQLQRAQALQARSGWGQWPACARSLGLL